MDPNDAILWTQGAWRCVIRAGPAGSARLAVLHGEQLVTAEATVAGLLAKYRAEVLRQRVLRGDLRVQE